MDGLIVKQPYATQIITGEKKVEHRRIPPPLNKFQTPILLLSGGYALGIFKIISFTKFESEDYWFSDWKILVIEKFEKPKKYLHPNGAQIWVKNVKYK